MSATALNDWHDQPGGCEVHGTPREVKWTLEWLYSLLSFHAVCSRVSKAVNRPYPIHHTSGHRGRTATCSLLSRNGKDPSDQLAKIRKALLRSPDDTVNDGEIVTPDPEGRTSLTLFQNLCGRDHTIVLRVDLRSQLVRTPRVCRSRLAAKCRGRNLCRRSRNLFVCPRALTSHRMISFV
jgi:hypothetical protein